MNANPLTMDFNAVDTSRKLLSQGHYELLIKKCEVQSQKNDPNAKLIYIELQNIGPAQGINGPNSGVPIEPNEVTVFDRINLQPSGKSTWKIVNTSIAGLVQAIPGGIPGASPANIPNWVPTLQGRTVKALVTYEPETTKTVNGETKSYNAKNGIKYYHKAA